MPPKTTDLKYPRLMVVVCASPEKIGLKDTEIEKVRETLNQLGFGAPFGYAPPLTAVDIAGLMGLVTEGDEGTEKFGDDFLFKDFFGKKVRATKNLRNRQLFLPHVTEIVEEILNLRYELNGDTIKVGDDGTYLDGQHQGVAVYLAQQRRDHERHLETRELMWEKNWPNGTVSIDKIVEYGIKNIDRVVNTIDTCRSRTFQNVLYRSPYFTKIPAKSADGYDRKAASSLCTAAVRVVWGRTGMGASHMSSSTKSTNTARSEWVENHGGGRGRFVGCVKSVLEANRKTESGRKYTDLGIDPGYAAGMMYLMMCSQTPDKKVTAYYEQSTRTAKPLSFEEEVMEAAIDFWTLIGRRNDDGEPTGKLSALTRALDRIEKQEQKLYAEKGEYKNLRGNLNPERDHTICAAWRLFVKGKKVTDEALKIAYTPMDKTTGKREFQVEPVVGGIDMGAKKIPNVTSPPGGTPAVESPTPDEIAAAATEIKNGNLENGRDHGDEPGANGHSPAVNDALNGVSEGDKKDTPLMEQVLEQLHKDHPNLGPILCRDSRGNYDIWGDIECGMVKGPLGREPNLHPSRMLRIQVKAEEFEQATDALTAKGVEMTVGVANKVDGVWQIISAIRPAKKKGPKNKKEVV